MAIINPKHSEEWANGVNDALNAVVEAMDGSSYAQNIVRDVEDKLELYVEEDDGNGDDEAGD